jgi:hypothetical protein
MQLSIIFIWGTIALTFFLLGYFHWRMADKSVSYFQVSESPQEGVEVHLAGTDYIEFVNKFNHYIDYYNQSSKCQNKTQAIGYWVASLTAIFSFILTVVS